jgi:acyl-CoA thioesterase
MTGICQDLPPMEFDADTAVTAAGEPGRFTATVSGRWGLPSGIANGGYLLAMCVQALSEVLPFPDPVVVSGHFLRPGMPGEATVETSVVREGRTIATGEARLLQGGREVVRTVASFGDLVAASGPSHVAASMPDLPPPAACVDPYAEGGGPQSTMRQRIETRFPTMPGWATGQPGAEADMAFWLRFRDGRPPDPISLVLLVDAVMPAVMTLGVPGSSTVELTVHVRNRPAPGWLACRSTTRFLMKGYHEEDFEAWDETGRLVAQARQFAVVPPGR